jgi:inhibitor of KinA sporulation pathway (predicted exonuclease)
MRWIVVDLEGTCWIPEEHQQLAADQRNECEIIEIGAVALDPDTWEPRGEFRTFVRPRRHPVLSPFCTRLTSITQADVDGAPTFPEAYQAFLGWAEGDLGLVVASWGAWDDRQLRRDAERWGLDAPRWQGFNVKRLFARRARGESPRGGWMGLAAAVTHLGGTFQGSAHRALDDAKNVSWVLARLKRP